MKRFYLFIATGLLYICLLPVFLTLFWILIGTQILLAPILAKEWLASAIKDSVIYLYKFTLRSLQHICKHDKHLMDIPLIEYKWFKTPMERRRRLLWKGLLMYEYKCILNEQKFGSMSSIDDINEHMDMRKITVKDGSKNNVFMRKEMELSDWLQDIWDKKINLKLKYKLLFRYTTPTVGEFARWNISSIKSIPSTIGLEDLPNILLQSNSLDELDKLFYQFTPKINKQPVIPSPIDISSRGELIMQPMQSAESMDDFLEFVPLRKTSSARELKSPQKSCLKDATTSSSTSSSPGAKCRRVSFASDNQEQSPTHSL